MTGRRVGRREPETAAVKGSSFHMADTRAGLVFGGKESEEENGGA